MTPPEEIEFERGCKALGHDRLAVAERHFTRALQIRPGWHDGLQRRAWVRHFRGRLKGAANDYRALLFRNPRCRWCLEDAADVQLDLGNHASASRLLDRALRIDPRNTSFRYDRACVRLIQGRFKAAIRDFTGVASKRRDIRKMIALAGRGRAKALLGDLGPALRDLDRAVKMRADVRENHFYRGLVRFLSMDVQGALDDLRLARAPRTLIAGLAKSPTRSLEKVKRWLQRDM